MTNKIITRKNKISVLVKKVRKLEFINDSDFLPIIDLADEIFDEWISIKNNYRNEMLKNKKHSINLYNKYEAEEVMVVGLLNLLNEKIVNYII